MEDFLVCKLFLTRSELSADDPSLAYEKMQWLKKHLQYGRPDLNEELKKIGLGFYKYVLFLLITPKLPENCARTCSRGVFRTLLTTVDGAFWENS